VAIAKSATATPIVITVAPPGRASRCDGIAHFAGSEHGQSDCRGDGRGAVIFRPPSKSGVALTVAFLKDPDGNQIELVEGDV